MDASEWERWYSIVYFRRRSKFYVFANVSLFFYVVADDRQSGTLDLVRICQSGIRRASFRSGTVTFVLLLLIVIKLRGATIDDALIAWFPMCLVKSTRVLVADGEERKLGYTTECMLIDSYINLSKVQQNMFAGHNCSQTYSPTHVFDGYIFGLHWVAPLLITEMTNPELLGRLFSSQFPRFLHFILPLRYATVSTVGS